VIGLVLRAARLGEKPGGFLVFNEGWYVDLALREQVRGAFSWFLNPLDLNNPPLFNGVAATLLRLHLPTIETVRFISVAAGIAMVVLTFLLGRLLYDERTALTAAAALSVMPGVVMVTHNIQVDPLFVALLLGAVFFYVLSARTARLRDAITGGVLLGLSILTKQPGVLALPALAVWETWRSGHVRWVRERRAWSFAAAAIGVGASWYAIQLLAAPQNLLGALAGVGGRPEMSVWGLDVLGIGLLEAAWMVFPVTAAIALAGIIYLAWERRAGDRLVLSFLAAYVVYFVFFHLHSYYLLPTTPFLALAIGRVCMGAFARRHSAVGIRVAIVSLLVTAMTLASVLMLGGMKWGRWSPMSIAETTDLVPGIHHVYVGPVADGYWGPTPRLADARFGMEVTEPSGYLEKLAADPAAAVYLEIGGLSRSDGVAVRPRQEVQETWYRPVLFGVALGQWSSLTADTQKFANGRWRAEKVGPLWRFGISAVQMPSEIAVYDRSSFP
jgi:4-amino-4-deoxy-L-arabinose transferase-like glycosyltransferase